MNQNKKKGILMGLLAALVAFALTALAFNVIGGSSTASADPKNPNSACTLKAVASTYAVEQMGLAKNQFQVNKINPNMPGATSNRGGAHSVHPLLNEKALQVYLGSGSPQALSYRQQLGDMKDIQWVSVQSLVPMQYGEATIWVNGQTVIVKNVNVPMGDVLWIPVRGCVVAGTPIRAACGNPVPSGHPPVCAVSTCTTPKPTPKPSGSTCPNGKPIPPNGLCPKDGSKIPTEPKPPGASAPNPIGTASPPTRPSSPDPTPTNGLPVHDVNPPTASAVPDSGSGAGGATAHPPTVPSAPAPAPSASPTSSGIVVSD